SLTSEDTAIYY
nr:immunoglobulin heavy chain junction region [Mus musculus]